MSRLLTWLWRRPCAVCERHRDTTTGLRQYVAVRPACPTHFHREYCARWKPAVTGGSTPNPTEATGSNAPSSLRGNEEDAEL